MSARELLELRKALERLRDALAEAMRTLDRRSDSGGAERDAYAVHGDPFGETRRGREIWRSFSQYTTRN